MLNFNPIKWFVLLAAACGISACATSHISFENPFYQAVENQQRQSAPAPNMAPGNGLYYRRDSRDKARQYATGNTTANQQMVWQSVDNGYQADYTHKSLADYAEQLSMQLVEKAKWLTTDSLIGVSSFVKLDQSLQTANVMGNQLSEYFISEIQAYGVSVIDFKLTDSLMVGSIGDFVFSREADELADELAMDYVLSGTMIQNNQGVIVNARIIDIKTKVVVSSAKVLIPQFVVGGLITDYQMHSG